MAKRYIRLNWQNSPSVATPVNAANLNAMDKGIDDLDNSIEDLYDVKFDKANIVQQSTVNDAAKVPSSAVTYSLANSISSLNDNLAMLGILESYVICSQIQGTVVFSNVIPLFNANMRYLSIQMVQVTAEFTLSSAELALLGIAAYKTGFVITCSDPTLNAKIAGKSLYININVS
ncbi:MAG: hypothetical protein K0R34_2458 [Herbinix sp.]|jgi:hypothetical protein|nr:hypothetical protein [Herbinix sp.]